LWAGPPTPKPKSPIPNPQIKSLNLLNNYIVSLS
jgi:hypothetical protein